jgi:hypothetical protein
MGYDTSNFGTCTRLSGASKIHNFLHNPRHIGVSHRCDCWEVPRDRTFSKLKCRTEDVEAARPKYAREKDETDRVTN